MNQNTARPAEAWRKLKDDANRFRDDYQERFANGEDNTIGPAQQEAARKELNAIWRKVDCMRRRLRHQIARKHGYDVIRGQFLRSFPVTPILWKQSTRFQMLTFARATFAQCLDFAMRQRYSPARTLALVNWHVTEAFADSYLCTITTAMRGYSRTFRDSDKWTTENLNPVVNRFMFKRISLKRNKRLAGKLARAYGNTHGALLHQIPEAVTALLPDTILPEEFQRLHTRVAARIEKLSDGRIRELSGEAPLPDLQALPLLGDWELWRNGAALVAPAGEYDKKYRKVRTTHEDPTLQAAIDRITVAQTLESLSPLEQQVYQCRHRDNLSYKQTAEVLNLKVGTIGALVSRINAKFSEISS